MEVSCVTLGTMFYGTQLSEEDAVAQMDEALVQGVNMIDTAEMYSVPMGSGALGASEEIIGRWMASRGNRNDLLIATKVMGPGPGQIAQNRTDPPSTEELSPRLDRDNLVAAVEGSLRRLKTDHIDLYQLHWPDRYVPSWGSTPYDPTKEHDSTPMEETVAGIKELLDAGKIRHWGLSNETSFGVCRAAEAARAAGVPPPISIQNDFSMCCRSFEADLAECCAPSNENVGLLVYGALAGGSLSGKYMDGGDPPAGTRRALYPTFQARYFAEPTQVAVRQYAKLADKLGISCAQLALAWCNSRWYVASTIVGASSVKTLQDDCEAFRMELPEEVLQEMDVIHFHHTNPQMDVPERYLSSE